MGKQTFATTVKCPRECGNNATIDALYGILPCPDCIAEDNSKRKSTKAPEFYSQTKQTRIQQQRDAYEKDMILPYNTKGEVSEEYRRADPQAAQLADEELAKIKGYVIS